MTEIVAVGGFGSTPRQYQSLADKLHEKFGPDLAISGVHFFNAINDPEALADKIHRHRVVTHSAGAYAVSRAVEIGAIPQQLDMIAPPSYDQSMRLALNGLRYDMRERRKKQPPTLEDRAEREANQILRHPQAHISTIAALGSFPTLRFAVACQNLGVQTRIGLMDDDGIFELSGYPDMELSLALSSGVGVRMISGNHTRFTREPGDVLTELELASDLRLEAGATEPEPSSTLAGLVGRVALLSSQLALPSIRRAA